MVKLLKQFIEAYRPSKIAERKRASIAIMKEYDDATLVLFADILNGVTNETKQRKSCGLCNHFGKVQHDLAVTNKRDGYDLFKALTRNWVFYSGYPLYPVPSTKRTHTPSTMYYSSVDKYRGLYGWLRKDLLNTMINDVNRELNNRCYSHLVNQR